MGSNQHGYFHGTKALPPYLPRIYKTPPRSSYSGSSSASFPILAIAILGIISTAFLLICYYVFVIKCCLNWHRFNLLRRFASSRRLRHEDSLILYSTAIETRGLDESVIRSIPILKFRKEVEDGDQKVVHECAVCLNEFQDGEKLRLLPRCAHTFHIDCIDTWLQSNANCPLCRSSISNTGSFNQTLSHNPSQEPHQSDTNLGESVVIEVGDHGINQTPRNQDLGGSGSFEFSIQIQSRSTHQSLSPRKLGPRTLPKKQRRFHHVSSMGDECIDVREKDEQFCVEPIRRSFSMDSSADRQLYLTVQEALRQNPTIHEVGSSNEGSSSRIQRSFFSFGHGRGSRNAVIPVDFDA